MKEKDLDLESTQQEKRGVYTACVQSKQCNSAEKSSGQSLTEDGNERVWHRDVYKELCKNYILPHDTNIAQGYARVFSKFSVSDGESEKEAVGKAFNRAAVLGCQSICVPKRKKRGAKRSRKDL